MGRKPINTFEETSFGFKKGTEYRMFDVKIPFSSMVTHGPTDPKTAQWTSEELIHFPHTEKDRITKLFQDKGFHVLKIEPHTVKIPGFCPKCKNHGVPKIEKKNTQDKRPRTWRDKDEKPPKDRFPEFWLTFKHDSASKCRISRFWPFPYPHFQPNKKMNFDFKKFVFPYALDDLEDQLSQ